MWSVARRPRWIAMLVLALAIAAGFAALGQWQFARAIANGTVVERSTEQVVPLEKITKPQTSVTGAVDQQKVSVTGTFVPEDYRVLSDRLNRGDHGFWLIGHLAVKQPDGTQPGLAVALGWSETADAARAAIDSLPWTASETIELEGRYLASEGPQESDFEHGKMSTMAVPALINDWAGFADRDVYGGYLVLHQQLPGLTEIDSPAPVSNITINWLNIFYAAEWAVFAGFAVFLWYRLVRDAWEREQEEAAQLD